VEQWNKGAPKRWDRLMMALRKRFKGADLQFWKVGELQERGLIHYHIILKGLGVLPQPVLKELAVRVGFGPVCWVERPREVRGGIRGLLGYYGKYLTKGVRAWDVKGQHVITHSQRWCRWAAKQKHGHGVRIAADLFYTYEWRWVGSPDAGKRELWRGGWGPVMIRRLRTSADSLPGPGT
jgi:hypothetical protein